MHFVASAHMFDAQGDDMPVVQAPAPLHVVVVLTTPFVQLPAAQTTELPGNLHARPSVPSHWALQGAVPPHAARFPRGAPLTIRHVPALLGSLHAEHWPVQALSQHTPSTQWPCMQSPSAPQRSPFATDAGGTSMVGASRFPSLPPSGPPAGHFTSVLTMSSVPPDVSVRGARPEAVAVPSPTVHPSARTARPTTVIEDGGAAA
jgi:hypothetical protein